NSGRTVEADPEYAVSVRRVSGESRHRRDSIEITLQRPNLLRPQASRESLHSIPETPGSPEEEFEGPLFPQSPPLIDKTVASTYQSLFGAPIPLPITPDPFERVNPIKSSFSEQRDFKLSRRDDAVAPRTPSPEDADTPTKSAFRLHTISERHSEEALPSSSSGSSQETIQSQQSANYRRLKRSSSTVTESAYTGAAESTRPKTPTRSELIAGAAAGRRRGDSRYITTEDLIARLTDIPARRARSTISQAPPELPRVPTPDESMQVHKRGERTASGLRRVGSQLDGLANNNARASGEHLIFGERPTTPAHELRRTQSGDVFEAWGGRAATPNSPTRPPSIRRRQSLMIVDLESKLSDLAAENTGLTQEKANVDKALAESRFKHQKLSVTLQEAIETRNGIITSKDEEIAELSKKLEWYRTEVQRLSTENTQMGNQYKSNMQSWKERYDQKQEQLLQLSAQHSELEHKFNALNSVAGSVGEKDQELSRLRHELEKAREEVRRLQRRVSTRQSDRYLDIKDHAHFVQSSARLFASVQEFATHFSSYSAGRRCTHVHRVPDDAAKDRFENVMLDDRGVRRMLKDEARRPAVFTAILMRLIWELVFTRYLFGLATAERHALLSLQSTLAEVGAPPAVHQWRATTLTLLSQRSIFRAQVTTDTDAAVADIMRHLNFLLPPPPQYSAQAVSALRRVLTSAVELALEMRTQRAEYVMLKAPRPIYDDNGEVSNTVYFNSTRMHALNHPPDSQSQLDRDAATVALVLCPLVIRRGNELGEDYHQEAVVQKMQVFVNRPQLRSESRATMRSTTSLVSTSTAWREDAGARQGVNRLTPITDHSPRTTPEKMRGVEISPDPLPAIPEQTVRLVEQSPTRPQRGDKKRRVGDW
ncbi:hypothetical protein EDC01DRAFT_616257, partial [Geopyxis carbonaria]